MFRLLDDIMAEMLEVSVEEYIDKIESCSFDECEEIIMLLLEEDNKYNIIKAKELFNKLN